MAACRCVLLIAALLLAVSRPADAQAPIATQILATDELPAIPAGRRWVVRSDHASGVAPHSHAAGFVYAATAESTVSFADGRQIVLAPGEAAWIAEGVPHRHLSPNDEPIWSFALESEADAAEGSPVFATRELSGFLGGPHTVQLKAETFVAGGATPPHRHFGPEGVYLRDGAWELRYGGAVTPYAGGGGYLADPLVPHRLRNVGAEPGRLFNLSLVPSGQPQGEPLPEDALR
jgi:quercetin dioxygenase-like cupin family protein